MIQNEELAMQDKAISKSFSILSQHLVDVEGLSEKYGMNDSEIIQLGIDMLALLDERNLALKFMKMAVERRERK